MSTAVKIGKRLSQPVSMVGIAFQRRYHQMRIGDESRAVGEGDITLAQTLQTAGSNLLYFRDPFSKLQLI